MKYISVVDYKNTEIVNDALLSFNEANDGSISVKITKEKQSNGGVKIKAVCTVQKAIRNCAVRLITKKTNWNTENYVFAPAALYNGNRFDCINKQYPPFLNEEESKKFWGKPVVTDVPRLTPDGNGTVNLSVGDLSFPCFGYFSRKEKQGYLLFFRQENELGNFGITINENAEKNTAEFILSSPCMRTPYKYGMCTTKGKPDDRPVNLNKGDTVTFDFTEFNFSCENETEFLKYFFKQRAIYDIPRTHPHETPWNYAFRLIEDKYNKRNWVENIGFYTSSEATSGICRQWQTGWVGGAINTLPAYILGNSESREKTKRTLDFIFTKLQVESGFLCGTFCDGRPYGDSADPENINIVLARKDADALYYLAKLMLYMKANGEEIPHLWHNGLIRFADAFAEFYKNNGEIGQFINIKDCAVFTSGSASAAILGAAFVLCNKYFNDKKYLHIAEELSEAYYRSYVSMGFTNGGPGEILSAPDSESAFALLESFVLLYREIKNKKWLEYAEDTAALCASWCVGYDYHYKSDTQFAERGTATTGAVWANVQNKHAAPGICTMSGESLFHLYRATGNIAYLDLLHDIAHNITQFVSTPEKPMRASYVWHNKPAHRQKITAMKCAKFVHTLSRCSKVLEKLLTPAYNTLYNPIGRINERVNLSDWEGTNNVGEVPLGSCWCEVSAMLTYLEIPAVYIQTETAFCFAFDHIDCTVKSVSSSKMIIELYNPTDYDAEYRIFTDKTNSQNPLPPEQALPLETVFLRKGERKILEIKR